MSSKNIFLHHSYIMSITVVYYKYAFLIFSAFNFYNSHFLFCTYRTFSITNIILFILSIIKLLSYRIPNLCLYVSTKSPAPSCTILQHFVAPIAYAPHLCYTTPTSNFGHDIFIMFQRPWKSPARISFLNFIAFSAKNSLRFLMMLLIHRNFKCPCTCISCMHTGQMLRYF